MYLKNDGLTETKRHEVNKRLKSSWQTTTSITALGGRIISRNGQKQNYIARDHSLSLNSEGWTFSSLRGGKVRYQHGSVLIQRLDSAKSDNPIIRRNTTLKDNLLGMHRSPDQRRLYSSAPDAMGELMSIKIELEAILVPLLEKNVKDFKKEPKTVWLLDEPNKNASLIKQAVKFYITICTFITAIESSKEFTRYLDIKVDLSDLQIKEVGGPEEVLSADDTIAKLENLQERALHLDKTIVRSKEFTAYNARNRKSNTIREKLNEPES